MSKSYPEFSVHYVRQIKMDWQTPPNIFHEPGQVYLSNITLEFGSRKVHGEYRKPSEHVHGRYWTRTGHIRVGYRKMRARTYRYIIDFGSKDIKLVSGTLKEPRFWYKGGTIRVGKYSSMTTEIPAQELEKIAINYKRREVRGSVVDTSGVRRVHWFNFYDQQLVARGYREDE